jgi:hypothetical protein
MLKGVTGHPAWTTDPTVAWWHQWVVWAALAGFTAVRFDLNWQDAAVVAKCRAIVGMLGALRPFVSLGSGGDNWQEPNPEDYAAIAGDIARELPTGAVLEVWNEPNVAPKFWPSPTSPERYAVLAQHTYDVVKAQADHVIVAAPNIAFNDRAYLEHFVMLAPRSFDWLAVHPYTLGLVACPDDPDAAHSGWSSYRATLAMCRDVLFQHGLAAPLAITEVGWPAADPGPSHYRAAINLAREAGVVAFGAFNLGDHTAERNAYSLLNPDGSPTLAATVIATA